MDKLRVADTPLAHWLNRAMGDWVDPETLVRGISQNQLRARCGLSQASIWEILKQGHIPKPETLDTLAEFFQVNVLVLYIYAYLVENSSLEEEARMSLMRIARLLEALPVKESQEFVASLVTESEAMQLAAERWSALERIEASS